MSRGVLTLVATPIGNLEDLSPRAKRTLAEASLVYAEDTRHSGLLLARIGVAARLRSCHDQNEAQRADEIVTHLRDGENVALISDAGTPGLADPGFRVVRAAIAAGCKVSMVPGPSSIVMALVLSGFSTDRFVYEGWLPRRSGGLRSAVDALRDEPRTVVCLESCRRLTKSLPVFAELLPTRQMAVCRELTKLHEDVRRGDAAELDAHYRAHPAKGEVVLVLQGARPANHAAAEAQRAISRD
jgi:16S rRNA (cytidine1402-2'-O)-methyltransferase